MLKLYQGKLPAENENAALDELRVAKAALSKLPPSAVVWDIEDKSTQPPWVSEISPTISSLGNYFVSSTGRDLFELLEEALSAAAKGGKDATIC
jgi:hypothetical protein